MLAWIRLFVCRKFDDDFLWDAAVVTHAGNCPGRVKQWSARMVQHWCIHQAQRSYCCRNVSVRFPYLLFSCVCTSCPFSAKLASLVFSEARNALQFAMQARNDGMLNVAITKAKAVQSAQQQELAATSSPHSEYNSVSVLPMLCNSCVLKC